MIYLDNAATSYVKPEDVIKKVTDYLSHPGNPGRGSHSVSLEASRILFQTRMKLANFFDGPCPERVIFTSGVTESLNMVIRGMLKPEDHVIITRFEHNSAIRPLGTFGIDYSVVGNASEIKEKIKVNTKAVIVNHASNVTGEIQNLYEVGKIAKEYGLKFIVDCAQSAGVVPISMREMNIDVLCFTGHKGLMGLQGSGGLILNNETDLLPLKAGGTGTHTFEKNQPLEYPDRLEAGTLNMPGIVALNEAIDFINEIGLERIHKHEKHLVEVFMEGVKDNSRIILYHNGEKDFTGIVSFNIKGMDAAKVCDILDRKYGICIRGGAHCAPLIHEFYGTSSMVRASFSWFNCEDDAKALVKAVMEIADCY